MTSRLDPLPNVAIDAMHAGTPMLCFEKACGLADYLEKDEVLKQNLVSQYLDINNMSEKAIHLINNDREYRKLQILANEELLAGLIWMDMLKSSIELE